MADSALDKGNFVHNNTVPPAKDSKVFQLFSLKGKTAIVSGAGNASGIGFAIAQAFAEAGANVAIWYNTSKEADDCAASIEKDYNVKCKAYQVNVQDATKVDEAIRSQAAEFNNRLDIFVANAGIAWSKGAMIDADLDHYRQVVSSNVDGAYYCARACGRIWRDQHKSKAADHNSAFKDFTGGSFIANASMSGHVVNIPQLQTAYNMSKAAVKHMCTSLAVEWAHFARVNSVSPGYVDTGLSGSFPVETRNLWNDRTPMGRPGTPVEMKGAFLFLASGASSFTTGVDILVDGGYHCP